MLKEEAHFYLNIRDSHGEKGVEKIESAEWKMRLCQFCLLEMSLP